MADSGPQARLGPPVSVHAASRVLTFLNGWGEKKEDYFMTCENDMKFKLQCPKIKSHWHAAMCILSVVACVLRQQP